MRPIRCYCASQHATPVAVAAATDEIKGNVRYPYVCSLGYDVDDQPVFVQCHAEKRILKSNPLD